MCMQAAHNSAAAKKLLILVKGVDIKLAHLMSADIDSRAVNAGLKRLGQVMAHACKVMSSYSGRCFIVRSVLSNYDQEVFQKLESRIKDIMAVGLGFRV